MSCFAVAVVLAACAASADQAAPDNGGAAPDAMYQSAPEIGRVTVPDSPQPAPDGGKATPAEAEMGKQAAEEIEKQFDVLDDPEALATIVGIVRRLAPHTQRPALDYQSKILAGGGINAFSLPGGYICVTQDLLEAVESEDELAAVIGHEMGHICCGHGLDLARREAKMSNKVMLGVLAAVLAGDDVDPSTVIVLGNLIVTGLLSGYSQQAELEADSNAVIYLQRAGYHPVAMLTVIEGLARMALTRPHIELGIFKTHPYPQERARAIRRQLIRMGLSLNPRPVLNTLQTKAEAVQENGRTIGRVSLDDYVVFEPAVQDDGLSPQQRAEKMAADLRRLILDNLLMYELRWVASANSATVLARGRPIAQVVAGDAEFHDTTVDQLAAKTAANIKMALWQETVRRAY